MELCTHSQYWLAFCPWCSCDSIYGMLQAVHIHYYTCNAIHSTVPSIEFHPSVHALQYQLPLLALQTMDANEVVRGGGGGGGSDTKSDAWTYDHWDSAEEEEEEFYEEKVMMKIQVLAMMVGIGGRAEPGEVLAEVVRVLKELDGRARDFCCSGSENAAGMLFC